MGGGGVPPPAQPLRRRPSSEDGEMYIRASGSGTRAPAELVLQLSVGLSSSALPRATAGFFLVLRLFCSLITGPLCRGSSERCTTTFTFLSFS